MKKIKIFSSDDPVVLAQVVNAYLEIHDDAEVHFAMTRGVEENSEPDERPKKGGEYIEYGICVVLPSKSE